MLQAGKIVRAKCCAAKAPRVQAGLAAVCSENGNRQLRCALRVCYVSLSRADDGLCSAVQLGAHLRPMLKGFHKQDESFLPFLAHEI